MHRALGREPPGPATVRFNVHHAADVRVFEEAFGEILRLRILLPFSFFERDPSRVDIISGQGPTATDR